MRSRSVVAPLAACALSACALSACTAPRPARPDAPNPPRPPMVTPPSVRAPLVDAAAQHLAARAPADRPMVLFLSVASGDASAALAARLREAVAARVRVTWAAASVTPGAPLPTAPPGAHVQSVQSSVTPWPDRVVRVSSDGATESVAVRLTGSDPLGPAEAGWEWFETRP